MEPTRDPEHGLVAFLDVLLRDGVVIQADVTVSVADVPLVAVRLRAAITGVANAPEAVASDPTTPPGSAGDPTP